MAICYRLFSYSKEDKIKQISSPDSMIKKIKKNFLNSDYLFYIVVFTLFILPFFWFDNTFYLLGEDDTGLSYFNPLGSLLKFSSLWFSQDSLSSFNPLVGGDALFAFMLYLLKQLTFNLLNLQLLAFSFILSFSFVYIVKILELITNKKSVGFYVAGLFYALSSYFMLVEYYYLMPSTFSIVLIPVTYFYLLTAIKERSVKPLLIGSIWTLFLSRSLYTPVFINSIVLLFLFVVLYSYLIKGVSKIWEGIFYYIKFILLILFINAVIIIPIMFSFFSSSSNAINDSVNYRTGIKEIMVENLNTELNINKLQYMLMNSLPSEVSKVQGFRNFNVFDYLDKFSPLILIIAAIPLIGILCKDKNDNKTIILVTTLFIISILIISVDIFYLFEQLYVFLILNTPFFNMNRYPSMKFHIPYVLFYALIIGVGFEIVLRRLTGNFRYIMVLVCFLILIIVNYQLISGRIFLMNSNLNNTTRAMKFNESYIELVNNFNRVVRDDAKLALFPLGKGYGAFILGENESQIYRSTLTGFKNLTGFNLLGNLQVFSSIADSSILDEMKDYYLKNNLKSFYSVAEKINLKYIIYTKDTNSLKDYGELEPNNTFLNKYYYSVVNKNQPIYQNSRYSIFKINNYNSISQFTVAKSNTILYFKKVSDFMYIAKIKTNGPDRIQMHEGYSSLWNVYKIDQNEFECNNPLNFARKYPLVYECEHKNNNLAGSMRIINMLNLEKLDYKHNKYNINSNSWIIDTKGDYIYVAIVMDGQKYLMLGVFVSSISLIAYLYFIFIDYRKKRERLIYE